MEREYIGIDLHKAFFQVCAVTLDRRAAVGAAMADDRRGDRGAADAVRRAEPARGGSVESDVGVRRSDRGSRRRGPRRRCAEDAVEGGLCGQDRPARCAAARRRVAARQRGRDLLPAAGDSRSARVVSVSLSSGAAAGEPEAADSGVAVAARGARCRSSAVHQRGDGVAGDARRCPGGAGASLPGLRQVLTDVRAQLVPVVSRDPDDGRDRSDRAAPWTRGPGFGPVFSVTLRAEIGTITRFPDGPHLASYAGLVPRVERSARAAVERPHHQGGIAVDAVGLDRSGDSSVSSPRRLRPVGAPPRRAERDLEGPRRRGARAVRRIVRPSWPRS